MCGRYRNSQTDPDEFAHRFGNFGPNIAAALGQIEVRPTDPIAIVRADGEARVAETVRWGFQPPNAKRPLINARDDKLLSSGLWSRAVRGVGKRILIPADGWYEWLSAEDPKVKKQPFLHTIDGGVPFAFAGLLGSAIVKGERVDAATIITTDSVGRASKIHDRMPVVLSGATAEDAWLHAAPEYAEDMVADLCVGIDDGRVTIEPVTL